MSTLALLRLPGVTRLLSASLLGRLPTGMVPLALVLSSRQSGSGFATAGLLTGAFAAGSALGGPALARVVDRTGQTRVLVGSAVASSAALALLPLLGGVPAVAASALAGATTPPLEPCLRALWPVVLPPAQAPRALAVDAAAQELVFVAGPLVVLGAVLLLGSAGGLLAAAGAGLAGAVWFAGAPGSRGWRADPHAVRSLAGPWRAAGLRRLHGVVALLGGTVGGFAVAAVAYAEGEGGRGLGAWLVAANAAGALAGGLTWSGRAHAVRPGRALPVLLAVLALTYLPLAATPAPAVMLVAAALSGTCLPAVLTCLFQLTDAWAPAGTTTEAFAWLISAYLVGSAVGAAGSGSLAQAGGVGRAFLCGAGLSAVAALVARVVTRRRTARTA